jgi:hypothetical protein
MSKRFKLKKSANSLTPVSPYVGYYNPKFDCIERKQDVGIIN